MKVLFTFLFFIGLNHVIFSQCIAAERTKVEITIKEIFQAISDRNAGKLKTYCTSDLKILENGIHWNLDSLSRKINEIQSSDFKRINTITFSDVTILDHTAWPPTKTKQTLQAMRNALLLNGLKLQF